MVNRKTGTFSIEVKKSVDKGVSNPKSRMCMNTHKQALLRWSPRVCQGKYSAGRIYSAWGCYSWHSDVQDSLGDFILRFCLLCMHECVSVCVCEPLISTEHMLLNTGETAAQ